MWIARCKDESLMAFNEKPDNDNFDYFGHENIESENFTDYGVKLPAWADIGLTGKHIDFEDGPIEIN